jgi:hypothetical protein
MHISLLKNEEIADEVKGLGLDREIQSCLINYHRTLRQDNSSYSVFFQIKGDLNHIGIEYDRAG